MSYYYSEPQFNKRELSKALRFLIFVLTPFFLAIAYKSLLNPSPSMIDLAVVLGAGVFLAMILCSFIRSPMQFIVAIQERIRWVYFHLEAAFYVILNIIRSVLRMVIRVFFWAIALIVYLVSPIDLIPDVLFPVGFLDDAGFTLLFFYFLNFALSQELKDRARRAIENAAIHTSFP
ncbi:YkvA family protein [Lewinella sp. LCG006]|uniref:YkvA family protein n=1 Tax=Lewinella sp. LCG006 TaxID=3231911 RepID=UPI003460BB3A